MTHSTSWTDLMESAGEAGPISFEPIPDGLYDAVVEKVNYKTASTGKPMYELTFNVESGPHAKRKLWTNMVVSADNANAMAIFFRQMAAMGLDKAFFATEPSSTQLSDALIGRRARLTVGHKNYKGQEKNEVTNIAAPQAATLPPGAPIPGAAPRPPVAPPPASPTAAAPPPPPPPPPAPQGGGYSEAPPF